MPKKPTGDDAERATLDAEVAKLSYEQARDELIKARGRARG